MNNPELKNLELFYDVVSKSNNLLYDVYHKPYIELLLMTTDNILAGEIKNDFENEEDYKKLQSIYDELKDKDFTVEDIRKAMQTIVLRCLKEMKIPNDLQTPDTIGLIYTYLLRKVIGENKKELSILDPLAGTGNLLFNISNHLNIDLDLYACDNDPNLCKLLKAEADLLSTNVNIYLQDALTLNLSNMDAVIFDMPSSIDSKDYFPYKMMLNSMNMLKDKGAIIAMVENDFFDHDHDKKFKDEFLSKMSIIGLIELPDELFNKRKPKIIIVAVKQSIPKEVGCFMVKLPDFTDVKSFQNSITQIESWFLKNRNIFEN